MSGASDLARPRPPDPEARPRRGHVAQHHRPVGGGVPAQPGEVVPAERGARHELERRGPELAHREVRLHAAAPVEELGVGDPTGAARDAVVAHPLEEGGRSPAGHLELRERGLVEQPHGLAGRAVLRLDGRGPQLAGPAARLLLGITEAGVRPVVAHAFPAALLPELGVVGHVPRVGRGDAQRPPREAFLARVLDVVVGLVVLHDPGEGVRRRPVLRAEPAHVHLPEVVLGVTVEDPSGHRLAHAPGPCDAVRAEPGSDPEPGHLGGPEAELVVGGERLGSVDHGPDLGRLHHRHPHDGVGVDLLQPLPLLREQPAVEVRRHGVQAVGPERERPRTAARSPP